MAEHQDPDPGFEKQATRVLPLRMDDLIGALEEHRVEYLIVGGWAVVAHGLVRATKDVDICPRPSEENYERLLRALNEINAKPILGDLDEDHDVELNFRAPGGPERTDASSSSNQRNRREVGPLEAITPGPVFVITPTCSRCDRDRSAPARKRGESHDRPPALRLRARRPKDLAWCRGRWSTPARPAVRA